VQLHVNLELSMR